MKSAKTFVVNMRPASSTGREFHFHNNDRYDTEFVKGGAKEVGCQELFEPYKKCIMVVLSFIFLMDRSA